MHQSDLASQLGVVLKARQWKMTAAESCTGGGVAVAVTEVAGSSVWFDRAFVTYSNESKCEMLGVNPDTLCEFGAVSEETVRQMAQGALQASRADVSVAISGIAGPDGGSESKPVGTVWMAWADVSGGLQARCFRFAGDRFSVRQQAVSAALQELINIAELTP